MLQSIMEVKKKKKLWDGYSPPVDRQMDGWMDGQTRVKTLPSHRTTYAGGKKWLTSLTESIQRLATMPLSLCQSSTSTCWPSWMAAINGIFKSGQHHSQSQHRDLQ